MKLYYESDANFEELNGKKIAILGYGSQGRAHSLNLKESGADVVVGLPENSSTRDRVRVDGLTVLSTFEAAKQADVIMVLLPDHLQEKVYKEDIEPNLKPGNSLAFAHGFAINYKRIVPSAEVDVFMIAPKGPGQLVRKVYSSGGGVPCLLAVFQDKTGNCRNTALAYAKGIGGTRAGVIETTFKEETETDLFGEQVVLCGGLTELIKAGFETLVNAGYQPEIAYFECMHEVKLIVDLFYEGGIGYMYHAVSDTAEYGGMTSGPKVITEETKLAMQSILKKVQDGSFADAWIKENENNQKNMMRLRNEHNDLQIEDVGKKLRKMMTWI